MFLGHFYKNTCQLIAAEIEPLSFALGMKFSSKAIAWTARLPAGRRRVEIVTCIAGCDVKDPQVTVQGADGETMAK